MYDGIANTHSANDFGARFYSSTLGRFLTPDWSDAPEPIPYADLSNPATLNLYAYAGNNPVTTTDPDGHQTIEGTCTKESGCTGTAVLNVTAGPLFPDLMPDLMTALAQLSDMARDIASEAQQHPAATAAITTAAQVGLALGTDGGSAAAEGAADGAEAAIEAAEGAEDVQFGNNPNQLAHAFRHIEQAGLNKDEVATAIESDLKAAAGKIVSGQPLNQTIQVGGRSITYTAYRLSSGVINVGRIVVH